MTQARSLDPRSSNDIASSTHGAAPVPGPRGVQLAEHPSPEGPLGVIEPRRRPMPATDGTHVLARALADYVRAVAEAVGVPHEGTTFEVTDTATAYLAVGRRAADHPDRDVMLAWSTSQGWVVSIETTPAEPPVVLSRWTGDLVPAPEAVARFVTESLTRSGSGRSPEVLSPRPDWSELAERMQRHAWKNRRDHGR